MLPRMPASVRSKTCHTGLLATAWNLWILDQVVDRLSDLDLGLHATSARTLAVLRIGLTLIS